jgi:prepilin-type N-terminal cleavage/methylation domain-containing protein
MSRSGVSSHPIAIARSAMRRRAGLQQPPRHDDSGFSLIELVIVIAILPIVLGGIATALISIFSLQGQTQNRIGNSNDALEGSVTFNKDVQSAAQLTTVADPTSAKAPSCGASGQTQLLGLEWGKNTLAPGGYDTVVSYVQTPSSQTPNTFSLVRQECTFGASTTPASATTLSRNIGSPVLTINPASVSTLASTGWTSAQGVTGITFGITEPEVVSGTNSPYTYSLVGLPGASTSTGSASTVAPNSPAGCNFASPGTGTYATQLCFVDFSSFTGSTKGTGACQNMQSMSLPIAQTPYTLSFCISESPAGTVSPHVLPTYYDPSGDHSEAFLGNNGFYTGVAGDPALYQTSGGISTVTLTNIQVLNAVGQPASNWTLVTGDAESTDANEWMVFQSNLDWSVLNNSAGDPYGNDCYDGVGGTGGDPNNVGFLQFIPNTPLTNGAIPANDKGALPANGATFPATGATAVLCEANIQLNKTGTIMLAAQEPTNSSAPQTLAVTMRGAGLQAMFLGVRL